MDSVAKVKSLDQVMNFSGLKLNVYELLCILFCIYFYLFSFSLFLLLLLIPLLSLPALQKLLMLFLVVVGYEMEKRI